MLAGGGARLGFEEKTAPWPFSICQSMSGGQEMRSFAVKMDTVEEIINNVNSSFSLPSLTSGASHFESQIPASMATSESKKTLGTTGTEAICLLLLLCCSFLFWMMFVLLPQSVSGSWDLDFCVSVAQCYCCLTFMLQAQLLVLY